MYILPIKKRKNKMIVLEKRSSGRRHEKRRRTWINESWKGITQILPPNNSVNILTKRKRKARELSLTVTPPPPDFTAEQIW